MDKIRTNQKEDLIIFICSYLAVAFVLMLFKVKLTIILEVGAFTCFMYSYKFFLDYITYSWTYISQEGMILKKLTGSKQLKWNEVKINIEKKRKDGVLITIGSNEFKKRLIINKLTIESIADLAKKHCPKDHPFYKIVEDVAEIQNIPF